jgi:ketosteroid isomerase-like protein
LAQSQTLAALQEVEQRWADAELQGDTAFLAELLTDDFVGIGPRGFMLTKTQWLARFGPNGLRYDAFCWDDAQVRAYGEAAIVTGRQTQTGTHQGHDASGSFRAIQVYVRDGGRWRLAAMQLSPLAPT